jgi:hypothetical protein
VQQGSFPSFDQFAEQCQLPTVQLRHRLKGGGTIDVDHWSLSQIIRFAPLTAGPPVQHALAILSNPDYCAEAIRAGIGIRSETGEQGRVRVRLAVWGMLSVLVQGRWIAYSSPVQISVGGLMAQRVLHALAAHYHICTQADMVWGRQVGYYELYLPLGPLPEERWSTRDGYSVTVVPLGSHHPPLDQVDETYLRSVAFPWNEQGGEETVQQMWQSVQRWAAWFSHRGGDSEHAGPSEPSELHVS